MLGVKGRFLATAKGWRKMFWSREFPLNTEAELFKNQLSGVLSRWCLQLQMK